MKRTWDQREQQPPWDRQHQAFPHQQDRQPQAFPHQQDRQAQAVPYHGHCSGGHSPQQHPWPAPPSPNGRQSVHWLGQSQGDEDSWRPAQQGQGAQNVAAAPHIITQGGLPGGTSWILTSISLLAICTLAAAAVPRLQLERLTTPCGPISAWSRTAGKPRRPRPPLQEAVQAGRHSASGIGPRGQRHWRTVNQQHP